MGIPCFAAILSSTWHSVSGQDEYRAIDLMQQRRLVQIDQSDITFDGTHPVVVACPAFPTLILALPDVTTANLAWDTKGSISRGAPSHFQCSQIVWSLTCTSQQRHFQSANSPTSDLEVGQDCDRMCLLSQTSFRKQHPEFIMLPRKGTPKMPMSFLEPSIVFERCPISMEWYILEFNFDIFPMPILSVKYHYPGCCDADSLHQWCSWVWLGFLFAHSDTEPGTLSEPTDHAARIC